MTRFVAALACAVAALTVPAQARAFAPIPITVRAEDDVARHRWPLTVSVPFARGLLHRGAAVKVVDEHGSASAVQARPLVTWADGSVRWLLLDTQIDVKPGHAHRLRVEPGTAPAPAATVRVSEGEDGVTIDTGAVQFVVPKKRFAIVDAVHLHGDQKPITGPLSAVLVAGERNGQAQAPTRLVVSEKGPLRARVDLQGTYDNHFDYVVRVEAYAGQAFVRVWHTFINRFPTPYVSVPRIGLELPLVEPFPKYRYDSEGAKPIAGTLREDGLRLFQPDNIGYQINGVATSGHLSGWIELEGLRGSIGLASRWFWQEYPQSISARADKLIYNLWAPEADPANAGVGAAKTHEFTLWFAKPRASTPGSGAALAAPLLGVVDPAHIAHSAALPMALAPQGASARFVNNALIAARRYAARNDVEVWNDCGAVHCDTAERPRTGAYGMWNWGDWNFRGYKDTTKGTDSWGNQEYDTSAVLALTYAASGAPDVHDMMVAAARHFIDVDTIHDCPGRPEWVGMNHPKNPLHFSFELGGPDLGHTWTQGSIAYYYLTGDERGLDAARGVADYLVERVRGVVRGNPRQWGWPQIALLAVWDATGDRRYLEAAHAYAEGGMHAHPPTASTQWKLGILADALAYTHAATGDDKIKAWLVAYADAVMKRQAREDMRAFPAVAYVAAITGNAAMRQAARERVDRIDLGSWGKPFSINGRIGFRIESLLAR